MDPDYFETSFGLNPIELLGSEVVLEQLKNITEPNNVEDRELEDKGRSTPIPVVDDSENMHYMHTRTRDGKILKIWECGICGKEFGHQYTLMRHLPTHTDERKFTCSTCGKAFRQMSTLSQHRAIHSSQRPYMCEICCKTFNRVSTLISHRKTHTNLKPYRCHLCSKAFHQKGNLRNHVFTHTNERPYKCEYCEKGFNQMSNLMCHKLKEHRQFERLNKYQCTFCSRLFPLRVDLRRHEHAKHGIFHEDSQLEEEITKDRTEHGVVVGPISTPSMQTALERNEIPFAYLKLIDMADGVLVRVIPMKNDKQMLIAITAEELQTYVTDFTITNENNGCLVKLSMPVVATVIQRHVEYDFNLRTREEFESSSSSDETD